MPGFTPKIPNGLEELMRGLAKSCIKQNPDNLYEFAAEYFENLLRDRDGTLDQNYKKFATYKVYKKSKKLKKQSSSAGGREASNDVNDASFEMGRQVVGMSTGNGIVDELTRGKSIEEIVLPLEDCGKSGKKRSLSISSESEINACIRREASFDTEAVPTRCQIEETADIEQRVDEPPSESMDNVEAQVADVEQGQALEVEDIATSADPEILDDVAAVSADSIDTRVVLGSNEDATIASDPGQDEINCVEDDDIANMVLDDEMEAAALKIQAQFRGFQARKVEDVNNEVEQPAETDNAAEEGSIEPCACELINEQQPEVAVAAADGVVSSQASQVEEHVGVEQEACDVDEVCGEQSNEQQHEEVIKNSIETLAAADDDVVEKVTEIGSVAEPEVSTVEKLFDAEEVQDEKSMSNDDEQEQQLSNEIIDEAKSFDENLMRNDDDENIIEAASNNEDDLSDTLAEVPEMDTVVVVESQNTNNTEDGGDTLMDETKHEIDSITAESDDIAVEEEVSDVANENENLPQDLPPTMIDEDNASVTAGEAISKEEFNDDESSAVAKVNESEDEREQLEFEEFEREIADEQQVKEDADISNENVNDENYQRETSKEDEIDIEKPAEHVDVVVDAENEAPENKSMNNEEEKVETVELTLEERDDAENDGGNEVKTSDIEQNDSVENEEQILDGSEKTLSATEEAAKLVESVTRAIEDGDVPLENSIEKSPDVADGDDESNLADEVSPVEEEICLQKKIEPLQDDDTTLKNEASLDQHEVDAAVVIDDSDNIDVVNEIEYRKLSEEELTPIHSVDEAENKPDDENEAMKNAVNDELSPLKMSPILNQNEEASPIELIDEVVNANADKAARELLNMNDDEPTTEIAQSMTGDEDDVVEPQLRQETLPSLDENRIDLSKEIIEDVELEPINDEILKPDEDVSEIPEQHESPPVDENMPQVSADKLAASSEEISSAEQIADQSSGNNDNKVDDDNDDVANMILDDDMEQAAKLIQAQFRGHQVRKSTATVDRPNANNNADDDASKSENVIESVEIDQCANEASTSEVNEREENILSVEEGQEDDNDEQTVEVERDDEGDKVEEENDQDEREEEEEGAAEEETKVEEEEAQHAVSAEEAETHEDAETADDPENADGDEADVEAQQAATNDDDDIANMVLDDEMEAAALKIQAQFRGFQTRKTVKEGETSSNDELKETEVEEQPAASSQPKEIDDEIANMVLDDEMENAALKIQSAFRGKSTRKEVKEEQPTEEEKKDEEEEEKPAEEEEKKEEEKQDEAAAAPEKTAKQLQEEADIADLAMDEEMEQTALKIQSVFRRKTKFGSKKASDESSACEQQDTKEESTIGDELKQSEDDEKIDNGGESVEDEKSSDDFAGRYRSCDESRYSMDQYDSSSEIGFYERNVDFFGRRTIEDPSLMQGGGVFVEQSYELTDMITSSSGEDRDPDPNRSSSSYEKVPSDKSFEIPRRDSVSSEKSKQSSLNDEKVIENFDFEAKKDTAEAMYYKLKKNEIESKKLSRSVSVRENLSGEANDALQQPVEDDTVHCRSEPDEDDDDVIMMRPAPPTSANRRLMPGMSMDERLLGSILSSADYLRQRNNVVEADVHESPVGTNATSSEFYPDGQFDPLLEATLKQHKFLMSHESDGTKLIKTQDFADGVGEEDTFDDFDTSNQIRRRIMASSISVADSFDFDPSNNKSIIDDDKIRTTLETIQSTDSESTIGSAATKIQNVHRRSSTTAAQFSQFSSIGNAAIDKSLDEFIYSQELKIDRIEDEIEGYLSPPPRKQESAEEWTDDTTTFTDNDLTNSEQRRIVGGGVIGIKVEQKSFLTVDERRQKLHREDAIQRNSTREEEDSSKSSNSSDKAKKSSMSVNADVPTAVAELKPQESVIDTEIKVPIIDLKMKVEAMPMQISVFPQKFRRQQTMPVQFQSDVIRVIPKHLRKRIKSAELDKKKKKFEK